MQLTELVQSAIFTSSRSIKYKVAESKNTQVGNKYVKSYLTTELE